MACFHIGRGNRSLLKWESMTYDVLGGPGREVNFDWSVMNGQGLSRARHQRPPVATRGHPRRMRRSILSIEFEQSGKNAKHARFVSRRESQAAASSTKLGFPGGRHCLARRVLQNRRHWLCGSLRIFVFRCTLDVATEDSRTFGDPGDIFVASPRYSMREALWTANLFHLDADEDLFGLAGAGDGSDACDNSHSERSVADFGWSTRLTSAVMTSSVTKASLVLLASVVLSGCVSHFRAPSPGLNHAAVLRALAGELRHNVKVLSEHIGERNCYRPAGLHRAATSIERQLTS